MPLLDNAKGRENASEMSNIGPRTPSGENLFTASMPRASRPKEIRKPKQNQDLGRQRRNVCSAQRQTFNSDNILL
jgi:hypothetical protein